MFNVNNKMFDKSTQRTTLLRRGYIANDTHQTHKS